VDISKVSTAVLVYSKSSMGWLRLVGSLKLYVSFAKEPYKRDDILSKVSTAVLVYSKSSMGWLQLVGSLNLYVSFAKEPY